jgi:membrane associated rhomboid family serine protease
VVASLFAALILFIIVFLIGEIAGFATRTSFPDGGTVYLILVTAFYFCFYSLMKFGEKETLLGFGPRFWLISTTTWLVFATITHICLSFSSYLSSNWITLILGLIGGIVGVLIFSKIKKGNQKPGK